MAKKFVPKEESSYDKKKDANSKRPSRTSGGNRRSGYYKPTNNKGSRDESCPKDSQSGKNSFNDLSWYSRNPELLASAAMLAFPNKPGMELRLPSAGSIMSSNYATLHNSIKLPGLMQLHYQYTIGVSTDVTSPASIAAKELFGVIRSKFSSSLGYDAPDLFMYMIALDQIHAYISYLKRIYRVINTYSAQNFYMPEKLLEAVLGYTVGSNTSDFDYSKFVEGKVKLWNYINTLVNMTNKFTFPNQFDLFRRHQWMNEHVYADAATMMGQLYIFVPDNFWVISDIGESGTHLDPMIQGSGSIADYILHEGSGDPIENMFNFGKTMIGALSDWEDAYTINGHMLRAFEGTENFTSALLMQDEMILIDYVPEVLQQIHNATVVEGFTQGSITQNPLNNAILYNPSFNNTLDRETTVVDLDTLTPSPAEVTIATRLTAVVSSNGELVCGSEVLTNIWITNYDWPVHQSLFRNWTKIDQFRISVITDALDDYESYVKDFVYDEVTRAQYTRWFKAPLLYRIVCEDQTIQTIPVLDYSPEVLIGEITNVATVFSEFLSTLHRVCLYSEFNCFGKIGK